MCAGRVLRLGLKPSLRRQLRCLGQFAQEFAFIDAVLERLAAVDEYDRDLVCELSPEFVVGVDVDLAPVEAPSAFQLVQRFLNDFTEMAALAGVDYDIAKGRHIGRSLAVRYCNFPSPNPFSQN